MFSDIHNQDHDNGNISSKARTKIAQNDMHNEHNEQKQLLVICFTVNLQTYFQ